MPSQSEGESRPEDTLANDSVRYLLLRMQLPTLQELKALDRRRRQTAKILSASRHYGECRRALKQTTNLLRTYTALSATGAVLWLGLLAVAENAADFAAAIFLVIVVLVGASVLGGAYKAYSTLQQQKEKKRRLRELKASLRKMCGALAPRLPVERVVAEARRSYPKFESEKRRVNGVKETIKVLRSNVAGFWRDVIVTMEEADRRKIQANIDASVRSEAEQYLFAWGPPPTYVDAKAKPRFGWSGYSEQQTREWDHWSHLVAAASGSRRAMSAMGISISTDGAVQLPPEMIPHSLRWQEARGIPSGQGVSALRSEPVADFEAALNFGEGPGQNRFLSLVTESERSHVDELLALPEPEAQRS